MRSSEERTGSPGTGRWFALGALLFGSGLTALVFQVLWVKQLSLVVGADLYAVTIGVSAFFAGLAIGGYTLGRLVDRTSRPLRFYAGLEVAVALTAVATTLVLARGATTFVALNDRVGLLAWLFPLTVVAVPATAMGGTLPALLRCRRPKQASIGRASGGLYAANTVGAIFGALAAPLLLVPQLGVLGSAVAAGVLNLMLAGSALALDRRRNPVEPAEPTRSKKSKADDARGQSPSPTAARWAVGLYAVAGATALGYEVVWTETMVPFLSTRTHAFSTVLATYLLGLALGSALYARFDHRVRRPWLVFGGLIGAAGTVALFTLTVLGQPLVEAQDSVSLSVIDATGNRTLAMMSRFAVAAAIMVLPVTILLGAAFPVVTRIAARAGQIGSDVGRVAALNTIGGIAGTFATGFLLVPKLGLVRTLGVLAVVSALVASTAWVRGTMDSPGAARRARLGAVALTLAVALGALLVPPDSLARLLETERNGELVYYDEGVGGTVAVLEQEATQSSFRRLYIQGVSNSGDALTSIRYMRLQALLPLMVHPGQPSSALVIGLGTGITCGSLLFDFSLEQRDCVELLPAVVRAAEYFDGNQDVTRDPRITLRIGDGRHDLLRGESQYDVITLEPPPPSARGVVNLYSREFYQLARDRLAPDGLLAQWWPLPTQSVDDSRSLVKSLLEEFPHVSVWSTELHEALLLASMTPLVLDVERITERFHESGAAAALTEVGIDSPAALLATWITDRAGLEAFVGDASPVTDDRPLIEHAAWVPPDEVVRIVPALLEIADPVPLRGGDGDFRFEMNLERQSLHGFYRAAIAQYLGDDELAIRSLRAVMTQRDNPYYSWFLARR